MKRSNLLLVMLILISQFSLGQSQSRRFKMEGINPETILVEKTFSSSTELFPFDKSVNKIYGLDISADIVLNNDESVVRFLLVDQNFKEYLIYETYSLLESNSSYSVENICEETAVLNGVKVYSVKIEINNAKLTLQSLTYSTQIEPGVNA